MCFFFHSYNHYQSYLSMYFVQSTHNPISIFFFLFYLYSLWIYVSSIFTISIDSLWLEFSLLPQEYSQRKLLVIFLFFFLLTLLRFFRSLIRSNINILLSSRECYVNFFFFLLSFVCVPFSAVIHFTACYGLLINVHTHIQTHWKCLSKREYCSSNSSERSEREKKKQHTQLAYKQQQ